MYLHVQCTCTFRHAFIQTHAVSKRMCRFRFGCNSLQICHLRYFLFTFRTNLLNYFIFWSHCLKKSWKKCGSFLRYSSCKLSRENPWTTGCFRRTNTGGGDRNSLSNKKFQPDKNMFQDQNQQIYLEFKHHSFKMWCGFEIWTTLDYAELWIMRSIK